MKIISEASLLSRSIFFIQCLSNLLKIISKASLLSQSMFLIQFWFKIDENPLCNVPSLPRHIPYSILIRNWFRVPRPGCETQDAILEQVLIVFASFSNSIHIVWTRQKEVVGQNQRWYRFLYILKHLYTFICLFQCMFLIQFVFKNWWTYSLKHSSSPKACFLFTFYPKLMKIFSEVSFVFQHVCHSILGRSLPRLWDAGCRIGADSHSFHHSMNSSGRRSGPPKQRWYASWCIHIHLYTSSKA